MIVLDPSQISFELNANNVRLICNRNFGIGADGICYGPLNAGTPCEMLFFNPDGSQSQKSGNGLRIFARYLWDAGYVTEKIYDIAIQGALSHVSIQDEAAQHIRMTMGKANFTSNMIPALGEIRQIINEPLELDKNVFYITCVNVGNPHCVIFAEEISPEITQKFGEVIEHHSLFPERINVQFVKTIDKHTIQIEIWERGAGYTLASGTSACATASASIINQHCESPITVQMAGGQALVEIDENWNITLTGTVSAVAQGIFAEDFLSLLD